MPGDSGKGESGPNFFGFMQGNGRDWLMGSDGISRSKGSSSSEERKLELRLGPPGGDDFWSSKENGRKLEKFSAAKPTPSNGSQKRTAPAPVVGWPPIRTSRRNLASSSSLKSSPKSEGVVANQSSGSIPAESPGKGLFVKINMEGIPIGRKVDLKACNSYDHLASAVDELFRGLLAAQKDVGIESKQEEEKPISGVLGGTGEYTLVYEDNEGDRILVGDVPWAMFVSTVKRLRVLKSSGLSATTLGVNKHEKRSHELGPSSR